MGWRGCPRRFTLLIDGGVLVTWACGATRVVADELAVDVELLADHLSTHHHHRLHLKGK